MTDHTVSAEENLEMLSTARLQQFCKIKGCPGKTKADISTLMQNCTVTDTVSIPETPINTREVCDDEIKKKLKHMLEESTCNHKIEIMKQVNIKRAHIYCKIHNLPGQVTGPLIEHYIKNIYGMEKNSSSLCTGDLQHNQINFEIKVSNGGKDNKRFNYVQLRMNHRCDYILTAYHINYDNIETLGELYIFKLTKLNIKPIILKYGGYAHGTITKLGEITQVDLENPTNDKEYAIRPKYGDKCWNELLHFRVQEI